MQLVLETRPSGTSSRWNSGGSYGQITPLRTFKTIKKVYCREFLEILGVPEKFRIQTACRNRRGVWVIID